MIAFVVAALVLIGGLVLFLLWMSSDEPPRVDIDDLEIRVLQFRLRADFDHDGHEGE